MVTANVLSAAVASVRDACGANLINVEEADGDNDSDHIPKINEPWGADNHNNDGDNGGAAVDSGGGDSDSDGDSGDHAPVVDVIVSFDGTWHKRDLHQTMV